MSDDTLFGVLHSVDQVEQSTSPQVVSLLYLISGGLSLLGSGTIIFSYLAVRELRRFPFSLVFFLSVCDFFFSIKFFVSAFLLPSLHASGGPPDWLCMLEATWTQFWGLGSVSWNGIISLNILILVRNPFMNPRTYVTAYHAYVWSLSLLTTALLLSTRFYMSPPVYGTSGDGTCWINTSTDEVSSWWQLLFLLPLLLYFAISLMCIVVALVRSHLIRDENSNLRRRVLRMLLFSLVFVGIWSEPAIHRVLMALGWDNVVLEYLDAICVSIQGFLNALVWLSEPFFVARMKETPLCLRLTYCTASRKHMKQQKQAESTALLNESQCYGVASIRRAVVAHLVTGISQSAALNDATYIPDKSFTTESYGQVYQVTKFSRPANSDDSVEVSSSFRRLFDRQQSGGAVVSSYAPHVFQAIRLLDGIGTEAFMRSFDEEQILVHLASQNFSEGRSGSFFIFTPDRRFIIKTVPLNEAMLLIRILRAYYAHLKKHPNSLLCRFYGVYQFQSGFSPSVYVIVMNNIFYTSRAIHQRYDLKGSWVRREVGERHRQDPSILGMDQDFVHMHQHIQIGVRQKTELMYTLNEDALLLKSLGIIDYSLLLGIHFREGMPSETLSSQKSLSVEDEMESEGDFLVNLSDLSDVAEDKGIDSVNGKLVYYMGVIDMLQLYDCNKQSERCWKVVCKCKDRKGLSVQKPREYFSRFVLAISNLTT